jgi:hypothetical protein
MTHIILSRRSPFEIGTRLLFASLRAITWQQKGVIEGWRNSPKKQFLGDEEIILKQTIS